jgi:hypothetical protein
MKTTLYSTASVAALLVSAGTALADDTFTGVAQFSIGGGTAEADFVDLLDDPFFYGGKAQGLWPLAPDFQFQADLFAKETEDLVKVFADNDSTLFGGAAHLIYVFENRGRFGLAGSVWETDVFSLFSSSDTDATYGLVALEAQFFGTDWTGTGQFGAFTNFDCGSGGASCFVLDNGTFLRGKLRYFLNDNTSLAVEVLRMWGNFDDDIFGGKSLTGDQTRWGFEAEHRFADSRFALFGNLAQESCEASFLSSETTTAAIGVKFYWNQASLRTNDKTGAEFDTPTFGHALEIAPMLGALGGP